MPKKLILRGTGELVDQIPLHSIHSNPATSVTHENLATLTSYSLLEKRHRTIIVPGTPSLWSPPPLPARITPDSGRSVCDAAGHVFPTSPLEPLLRALFTTRPDYNLRTTDLITDRRNLRLLFEFAAGEKSDFRINVEVAGNTVLFSRWMKSAVVYVRGFEGYGHSFETAFTKVPNVVRGSIAHNRVVAYELGGVRIIMRFEVDAYVGGSDRTPGTDTYTGPSHAELRRTNVQPPTGLTVRIGGQYINPARIAEIKTSAAGKALKARAKLQVWLSQTPYLFQGGYREGGVFDEVKEVNMFEGGKMDDWVEVNKEKIRRLVRVIEMVREAVRRRGGKCVIVHEGDQVLKIYSVVDANSRGLPPDLLERWKE